VRRCLRVCCEGELGGEGDGDGSERRGFLKRDAAEPKVYIS